MKAKSLVTTPVVVGSNVTPKAGVTAADPQAPPSASAADAGANGESQAPQGTEKEQSDGRRGGTKMPNFLEDEIGILLMVILAGAVGGAVHALNSYVNFIGQPM
ncbi:MAG: hypothetical protein J6386_16940 [Candidatus Synoicihabitans palmerolidicus]|nr:hypothetical protein [Candidatus Synoicihabitans palmerolidicus]